MADLTTLFWNIWFDIQDGKYGDGTAVLARLEELITEHNPDIIGLNEVLATRKGYKSKILTKLKQHGYHVHFSPVYEHSDDSVTGNVFASKQKPHTITHHDMEQQIGLDPKHHRYLQTQMTEATIRVKGKDVTIFVTHLCSIWPRHWPTHRRQRLAYEKLVDKPTGQNVIIGGDFNETKYMFPWLRRSEYHSLTGGLGNPTWRWRGKKARLLHGNLDRILYSKTGQLKHRSFTILDRAPSDHAPLLATFKITK